VPLIGSNLKSSTTTAQRFAGESKYRWNKMIALALMQSLRSGVPLRLIRSPVSLSSRQHAGDAMGVMVRLLLTTPCRLDICRAAMYFSVDSDFCIACWASTSKDLCRSQVTTTCSSKTVSDLAIEREAVDASRSSGPPGLTPAVARLYRLAALNSMD